jgi:hypothetical protein
MSDEARSLYSPAIGDMLSCETSAGIRYTCTVAAIRPDGWLIDDGSGMSFHPVILPALGSVLIGATRMVGGRRRSVWSW